MDFPFRRISPEVGSSKPAIMRRVVVFPHPEGPRNVTNSPRRTSRLKSSTAVNPSLNDLVTCFSSMMLLFSIILSL